MLSKGYVSAILEGGKKVRVIPAFLSGTVTHDLVVPYHLFDCLEIKTEVVFCSFPDNTGIVLDRMDGEYNHKFEGDLEILGTLKAAAVIEGTTQLGTHTHTDSKGGETTAPK